MTGNAEIILVRKDGALILQQRDDKPGITNPGMITSFGGHIEPGETPLQAAVRELNEETNLNFTADRLSFFGKYRKTKKVHGEDWDVYYFVATDVDDRNLKVFEGQGFVVAHTQAEVYKLYTSTLLREVLADYYASLK